MTCRAACRSHPFVFAAIVALSAVAFVEQAVGTPAAWAAGVVATPSSWTSQQNAARSGGLVSPAPRMHCS